MNRFRQYRFLALSLFGLQAINSSLLHSRLIEDTLDSYIASSPGIGKLILRMPAIVHYGSETNLLAKAVRTAHSVWVRELIFYTDYEANKPIARYLFTVTSNPVIRLRIKVCRNTTVHVIAVLSNGKHLYLRKKVRIGIRGCK